MELNFYAQLTFLWKNIFHEAKKTLHDYLNISNFKEIPYLD